MDLGSIETAIASGTSTSRTTTANTYWTIWVTWRATLHQPPYLDPLDPNRIHWLLLFAQKLRTGELASLHGTLRARTVEDYIRHVSQAHLLDNRPDPSKDSSGQVHILLQRLYTSYKLKDPPPRRVKPIPVSVLHLAYALAHAIDTPKARATADLIWIAFFFLLRPGEYAHPRDDSSPFRLCDIELWIGSHAVDLLHGPLSDLDAVTFTALTFTNQKNAVRGEKVGHSTNASATANPVRALARRISHLRLHSAPATTPICSYYDNGTLRSVKTSDITTLLRQAVALSPSSGLVPSDVSARSLRASGAMALLCHGTDDSLIRLLGRWKSDEMFRYLHLQAQPLMRSFSTTMLSGGDYSLLPTAHGASLPVGTALVPLH